MTVPLALRVWKVKINPLPRKSVALTDAETSEDPARALVEEDGVDLARSRLRGRGLMPSTCGGETAEFK